MGDNVKIVIDTKGNDNGALSIISGAFLALEKFNNLSVLLVGDYDFITSEVEKKGKFKDRIEILNATDEITNYDSPARAVFAKAESSMIKGIKALAMRDDLSGFITAGNTGVLLVASMRYLMSEKGARPALGAVLPSANGGFTCIVDAGATVDCEPNQLLRFAHLGKEFMKDSFNIENPRIGLLSNGSEPTKGNKLVVETHGVLKQDVNLNFIGNVEGNVALSGVCDVLVCDGFAGNQVLKVTEGTAIRIITDIIKYAKSTANEKIGELANRLASIYDISSLGGGYILGALKPVVKIRGNAGEKAVVSTAEMILNVKNNKSIFDKNKNKI